MLNDKPIIMGILNITPDSFYESSRCMKPHDLKKKINQIIDSDIIDIGAESSRPNSKPITINDELNRLEVVFDNMELFENKFLSIDTYKPLVAKKALMNGFSMINDIYGGVNDEMIKLASESNVKIILMHIKGQPETMQDDTCYEDIIDEIMLYFDLRIKKALEFGVKASNIIIDPGIGFGKSLSDNYKIINNISKFKTMGFDIMIGLSRKSFLSFKGDKPLDRLPSTITANTIALLNGANIIRVHDVKEHIRLIDTLANFKLNI